MILQKGELIANEIHMNVNEDLIREDFIDEEQEEMHDEYKKAAMSLGLPEDEAEIMIEDMGF